MKKKTKNRKILIGRIYDILLIPIYIIITCLFLNKLRVFTSKYMFTAIIIAIIILAITLLTFFYNKKVVEYLRRIILTLICAVLLFGYFTANNVHSFFGKLTNEEPQYVHTQLNLLSLKSNDFFTAKIEDYEDLDGAVIGIQTGNDEAASSYVKKELNKKFEDLKFLEYGDYGTMISDLSNDYIDVACFNVEMTSEIELTYGTLTDFTNMIKTFNYKEKVEINRNDKDITEETFTVFISGNDETGAPASKSKSDMNMLVIVNPLSHKIVTVPIPRDAFIPNPAYNYEGDKLTHTGNDGVENTKAALSNVFGFEIDFYIKISFDSFIEIVNAIGGVEVNVPIYIEEQDENRSFEAEDMIYLNPGVQTLDGREALAFARHRHGYANQDLGRNEAQLQIIKAIAKKMLTIDGISNIDKVLDIIPKYVLTNFSNSQLQAFVKKQVDDMPSWDITSLSLADVEQGSEIPVSWPYLSSICYLKEYQVKNVHALYSLMSKPITLERFKFDLNTLNLDELVKDKYEAPDNLILY